MTQRRNNPTTHFILMIVNFLVLDFLFGERTLRNIVPAVLPVIELIWGVRREKT